MKNVIPVRSVRRGNGFGVLWGPLILVVLCLFSSTTVTGEWKVYRSGTLAWLHSIYFVNENEGWIVGSSGTILTTQDGGSTWRQEKKFTRDNIRDVFFKDTQKGWLLCEGDIYSDRDQRPSYIMTTDNGGANWTTVDFDKGRERLVRFVVTPNRGAYVVGEQGALWQMRDDGNTWKRVPVPVMYLILGGHFTSESSGILVGGGGMTLMTGDGGKHWEVTTLTTGDVGPRKLSSAFFSSTSTGWVVGLRGAIYFTDNGGKAWRPQTSGIVDNLADVFFVSQVEGFSVGDEGTILHTRNAGKVWDIEMSPSKNRLERVLFNKQNGFAVGFGGTILTYAPTVG